MIHSTAIVSEKAQIGNNVEIGPFTIVEENVIIGNDCKIGAHVTLASGLRLGKEVKVFNNAVLGTIPQDLKFAGEETTLEIGDRTVIREFAFLNRGTKDKYKTVIGKDCFIMAYVHVAHDCFIGDHTILVNGTQIAGHCTVGDFTILSGNVLVHQFSKIGSYCMVEGGAKVKRDIPHYVMAVGEPLKFSGLNKIGLQRKGFSTENIQDISDAYRIIYRSELVTEKAIEKIENNYIDNDIILKISEFLRDSKHGIIR
ncbi:MAG: acyl-ACP--UDP-N-acetylglucosamine O-acyltransferase [Candidatus Delongbacteria bacterium]|nr:acyl-ACP--UDP-N-acetylglucosamine O-acyltransferase [Candidatus Delongbacteria bacterium]